MRSMVLWPGLVLSLLLGLGVGELILSQELPPEIRADQYLLEGQRAVKADDPAAALRAFKKLEALPVDPPVEFFYWYGQALVADGISRKDVATVNKGEGYLKQYVLDAGRDADHYASALEWISRAKGEGLPRPQQPAEDAAPSTDQVVVPQEPVPEAKTKEVKLDRCDNRLWGEWECSAKLLVLSRSFNASGIEQVTIDQETGIFSRDRTTYPVDEKWHPNSKTGKESVATCGGWNKYGFRDLQILIRDAPGQRSAKYVRYYVNDDDTLWVKWGDIRKDQNGKVTTKEYHKTSCYRE